MRFRADFMVKSWAPLLLHGSIATTQQVRLRGRTLLGVVIFQDFCFDERRTWMGGIIYDPNHGRMYNNTP